MKDPAERGSQKLPDPTIALILGWLIPGAGHWYLGHRGKAILFLSVLTLTFTIGFGMAECRNVSIGRHPWYFLGQSFLGLPTVLGALVTDWVSTAYPLNRPIPGEDMGTLYTCVASLLNGLLFLDAYEIAERKRLGLGPGKEGGTAR